MNMTMTETLSILLNILFGGGLIATVVSLLTMKSEVKKAKALAESADLDNIEKATSILMENIVKPLKREMYALRKETSRLRRAIDQSNNCEHSASCPVRKQLSADASDSGDKEGNLDSGRN